MKLGERIYRWLLRLYPSQFREEYGDEMTLLYRDRAGQGPRVWAGILRDLVVHAPAEHMDMFAHDAKFSLRTWRRTPGSAALAVLALALGVGATVAIFSVVHAVLLRPLPMPEPERLVRIYETSAPRGLREFSASIPNYLSWKEESRSLDVGAISSFGLNLTGNGEAERVDGYAFTANIPQMLGARTQLGRWFLPEEESRARSRVVVLGHGFWQRRFSADPAIVGRSLTLNGSEYQVVGVAAPEFEWPDNTSIWSPLIVEPAQENRANHYVTAIGRIRPGFTTAQASEELSRIARDLESRYPKSNKDWGVRLVSFHDWTVGSEPRAALPVLLAAVLLVLLIACANVANLLLARAAGRSREIAVRSALGAGAARLWWQLLTEGVLLAVAGGTAGIAMAWILADVLRTALTGVVPRASEIALDRTALAVAFALIAGTGLVFGMAPLFRTPRTSLSAGRSDMTPVRSRTRNLLVAGQVALATMLLIGAALTLRSLNNLHRVQPGFDSSALLTGRVSLPRARYRDSAKAQVYYSQTIAALETIPGVRAAAFSSGLPLTSDGGTSMGTSAEPSAPKVTTQWRLVTPNYFRAMSIPLLRGETFEQLSAANHDQTVVINQETARRIFADRDPVGSILFVENGVKLRVIGVVGDVAMYRLRDEPMPTMYFSTNPGFFFPVMKLAVRTSGDPMAIVPAVRRKLAEVDSSLPLYRTRTMEDWIAESSAQPRFQAWLLGAFAALAMLLGATGIFGVVSYAVGRRTREFGLRSALGATPAAILRQVLGEGLAMSIAGIVIGVVGAWFLGGAMETVLFGVNPRDPATFALAAVLLGSVALLATWLPARRATRVDPMEALRAE